MIRRFVARMLVVTLVVGAQGSLMYAAASPTQPATATVAHTTHADLLLPFDGAAQCLRGGGDCFGWGSANCCHEMFVAAAVAGATGAWLAAGIAAWYMWGYCPI